MGGVSRIIGLRRKPKVDWQVRRGSGGYIDEYRDEIEAFLCGAFGIHR